jgi:hypothetical protein
MRWLIAVAVILLTACQSQTRFDVRFLNDVCIKPYSGYHYLTCNPISVQINDDTVTVPAGFETDLASIPRIAWPVISPMKSYLVQPAILHDWMYHVSCGYSRYESDVIFYEAMRVEGVSGFKAGLIYYAVRWFGWPFYSGD